MSIFFNFNEWVIFIVLIKFHGVSLGLMNVCIICSWLHREHDNGLFMAGKQAAEPLSFKTPEMMMSGDKRNVVISENRGLYISRGTTGVVSFFYRNNRPTTDHQIIWSRVETLV